MGLGDRQRDKSNCSVAKGRLEVGMMFLVWKGFRDRYNTWAQAGFYAHVSLKRRYSPAQKNSLVPSSLFNARKNEVNFFYFA